MSDQHPTDAKQLQTLERLRSMELESSQAQYVRSRQVEDEKQVALTGVESRIVSAQALARQHLTAELPLSADRLRLQSAFAALQAQELAMAQVELQASRERSEESRTQLLDRFEQLAIVERLRERRAREAAVDATRLAQKQIDEQALSRVSGPAQAEPTQEE